MDEGSKVTCSLSEKGYKDTDAPLGKNYVSLQLWIWTSKQKKNCFLIKNKKEEEAKSL